MIRRLNTLEQLSLILIIVFLTGIVTAPVYGATADKSTAALFVLQRAADSGEEGVEGTESAAPAGQAEASGTEDSSSGLSLLQIIVLVIVAVGLPVFLIIRARNKNKDLKAAKKNQNFKIPGKAAPSEPLYRWDEGVPDSEKRWALTGVEGTYAGRKIPIVQVLRFGRNPSQANVLFPNGTGVSNAHCEIILQNYRPYIRDLASTYGTFVNGQQLIPQMLLPLKEGDSVSLGNKGEIFSVGTLT